jgi:hypothetical protein
VKPTGEEAFARLMVLRYVIVHALATPRPMLSEWFGKWPEQKQKEFDEYCKKMAASNVASMQAHGLWECASSKEKDFLQSYGSRMDEYAHRAATWRMECAGIIMWALGLLKALPPLDRQTETELLKSVPIEKVGCFSRPPTLRRNEELAAQRNVIELWHWRVRTRQLIEEGRPFPSDERLKGAGINSYDDIVRTAAKTAHGNGDLHEIKDEDFVYLGKAFRDLTSEEYQMATSIIMERHYAMNWLCGMAPGNRWDETPRDT